jgi:hypothetical protein
VEKKERVREEGEFGDKEKFITESYARQLELNKKEEMIVQMEEKLNQNKTMTSTGMMAFYSNLLDNKLPADSSKDIREKAKTAVTTKTNIDTILDKNEQKREIVRKEKEEVKKQAVRKEVAEILKAKMGKVKKRDEKLKQKQDKVTKEQQEQNKLSAEEKRKREREEKLRKAKERYEQRKNKEELI